MKGSLPPFLQQPGAIMPAELHGLGPSVLVTVAAPDGRPSAASFKHNHGEAFCLMAYASKDGTRREVLWNSRDGVTPFGIPTEDGVDLFHITWPLDVYAPAFIPPVGMRIFVDLTEEAARSHAVQNVERNWDHPEYPMSERFESKEQAVKVLAGSYLEQRGEPDIVVVTEELQREFLERANRLYAESKTG